MLGVHFFRVLRRGKRKHEGARSIIFKKICPRAQPVVFVFACVEAFQATADEIVSCDRITTVIRHKQSARIHL